MRRDSWIGRFHKAAAWAGVLFLLLTAAMNAGLPLQPVKDLVKGRISFEDMTEQVSEAYLSDGLWKKEDFIGLNGLYARATGQREYNGVLLLNNGMLTYGQDPLAGADLKESAGEVGAFSAFLSARGIPYLFVQAPIKMDLEETLVPMGYGYVTGQKTDEWVRALEQEGVRVLDLRTGLTETVEEVEKNYYRTDHHWTADGAFRAFGQIMTELDRILGGTLDLSAADPDAWQHHRLDRWFLGTHGKRVGTLYAGLDPLTWNTPLFAQEMSCTVVKYGQIRKGSYEEANLRTEYLENKDYYSDNAYCVTIGGDYPLVQHRNADAKNDLHLLVLKDSYVLPLQCCLSTAFTRVDVIDPRHYTEAALAEYCLWTRPDLVLTVVNPSSLSEKRHFTFGQEGLGEKEEREVLRLERLEIASSESPHRFEKLPVTLSPGETFRFSFESLQVREGETAGVSVLLFDLGTNTILRHQIFDVGFSARCGEREWTFRVPEGVTGDLGMLVYAGVHGQTQGIGIVYEGIRVTVLE